MFLVSLPVLAEPLLRVSVLEPKTGFVERGSDANFSVLVLDANSVPVKNAIVTLLFLDKRALQLEHSGRGVYNVSFRLPLDFNLGKQNYSLKVVIAGRESAFFSVEKSMEVRAAIIRIVVLSPEKKVFRSGDKMNVEFAAVYGDNSRLFRPIASANVAGYPVGLVETQDSVFSGSITVPLELGGTLPVFFSVSDAFGNHAEKELFLDFERENLLVFLFKTDLLLLAIIVFFLAGVLASAVIRFARVGEHRRLEERKRALLGFIAEIQALYYRDSRIGRQEYKGLFRKYSSELERIESKLQKIKKQ